MSILEPEASIWYVACWIAVGARLASKKIRFVSWRHLEFDDYLVVLAMMTLTVLFSLLHVIIHTSSNLIAPEEDASKFTADEVQERIYGSKLTIITEQMQIMTIWLLKACILTMYGRMTGLLSLHLAVKGVAIYVGVGFFVMEVLWFGVWCQPFDQYWAVPTASTQCSAMVHHLITNAVVNISSDLMIMAIPIPLLIKVKLPLGKKLILGGMFFVGSVTIFAAAYNKYKSFMDPFSTEWIIWYLREAFTAMLCANLPLTRPVIQRVFNVGPWVTEQASLPSRYATGRRRSDVPLRGDPSTRSSTPKSSVIINTLSAPKPLPALPLSPNDGYITIAYRPLKIVRTIDITVECRMIDSESSSDVSLMDLRSGPEAQRKDADGASTKSWAYSVVTRCYHAPEE